MAYQHAVMAAQNTVFVLTQHTERNWIVRLCLFHLLDLVRQQYTRIAQGLALLFLTGLSSGKIFKDSTFIEQVLFLFILTVDAW